ncbi:MAG: TonB family protein [Candidatus Eremiobacteraeota bacterium]|nr:TonB family protein [Candidatus Eremiobacteraeota bacterium]
MKRFATSLAALALTAASVALGAPALAVYSTDYVPPKAIKLGTPQHSIAGSGTVVVKVLVHADGSAQVQGVIRSSNHANDAAALDVARGAKYRAGTRGGQPVTTFYDFTVKFNGKAVSEGTSEGSSGSEGGTASIYRMLRAGNYAGAKSAATSYTTAHPDDASGQVALGLANAFTNDNIAAAQAFEKAGTIPSEYRNVAAQSYALAAVQSQKDNPTQALAFGNKAVSLAPSGNSYFALGVAELASNDATSAERDLQKARSMALSGKASKSERENIDSELMQAALLAKDQTTAQAMADDIKQINPSSTAPARAMANYYYAEGQAASKGGKPDEAVADYEKGAAANPEWAVTGYTNAAFVMSQGDKPDFNKMKAEADKAIALNPNDPNANFAEGIALTQLGVQNKDAAKKQQGLEYLKKADAQAKAANNTTLAAQIENFINGIPK